MKVALIYPKIDYDVDFMGNDGYAKNMSGYPPLSLAYVAAVIKKAGHEVIIIDGNISNLSLESIVERLKIFRPGLLGFTVTIPTFQAVSAWIRGIKKFIDLPIIIGGSQLELYLRQFMLREEVDYALYGAITDSLPRFLEAFDEGASHNFPDIPGLCFRKNGEVVINKVLRPLDQIGELPFPARELLPNEKYFSPFSEEKNFTAFLSSKGCFFRCLYCCLAENPQSRKIDAVLEELEECSHDFKIKYVDFYDPVFTIDKERVLAICKGIRERNIPIKWSARTHIRYIDEELLEEMASSGCRMIMYGIESANEKILKGLSRDFINPDKVRLVAKLTKNYGITSFGFFMLGAPGETESTMKETIDFSKSSGLDFVQFTRLIAIPGTKLYQTYLSEYKEDYWGEIVISNKPKGRLLPVGTKLTSEAIVKRVKEGNIGFYLRPGQILKMIITAKSPLQLMNFVRAGINMLGSFFINIRRRH